MKEKKAKIEVGSIVFPIEARCGRWMFPSDTKVFIYNGAIPVCKVPNRERPIEFSEDMYLGSPGMVLERFESRYPMLRIMTVKSSGEALQGWVLESDVALADEGTDEPDDTLVAETLDSSVC